MRAASTAVVTTLGMLAALAASGEARAADPRDPGDGVVRLRGTTFRADVGYDDEGRAVDDAPFATQSIAAMIEVGVAPRLTFAGALPLVWVPERGVLSGGDLQVGGLVSLLEPGGAVDLALALEVKLPLYASAPSRRGRAPDGLPAIGDGQVDVTAAAVFVAALPLGGAMDLYAGYRIRTGNITDAAVGGGRIGLWLLDKRFFASLVIDTVVSFDAAPGPEPEIVGRGYGAFGPRLHIRIVGPTFLEVSALAVGRGKNAAGGVELGVGITRVL
jgi:hypothetical protein